MDEIQIYNVLLNSNDRMNKLSSANEAEFRIDWGSILSEGKYRVKYSIVKSVSIRIPYLFRVKSFSSVVPSVVDGLTLVNTNNVTMIYDGSRGYVFSFNGLNSLKLNVPTPTSSTKTFWVSVGNPSNEFNNVYSSVNRPIYFLRTSFLKAFVNFSTTNIKVESNVPQTVEWKFYAVTVSPTETKMYVNGILTETRAVSSIVENSPLFFGSYEDSVFYTGKLDDMRMYDSILPPAYIERMYKDFI
jgi:Concanavalin A-like lectin/glucanases superfamily